MQVLARFRKTTDGSDVNAENSDSDGFTLIELLVVMIIIGILAAIAIPAFLNQRNSAYDTTTRADIKNGSIAEEAYNTDYFMYTSNGAGAAGTASGPLLGWSKSNNTTSVTFTPSTNPDAYKIVGVSKSGKSFCFNSLNSGGGVVTGSTC